MKVLILISCTLAVASAAWIPQQQGYHGPLHHPVIHDGVPVETPEVQHARAAHLAALAEASSHVGYHHEEPHQEVHHHEDHHDYHHEAHQDHYGYSVKHLAPVHHHHHHEEPVHHVPVYQQAPIHNSHHIAPAYETTHSIPAIGHDGIPLDTPEVEAAKAHHFAAFNQALAQVARATPQFRQRRSIHEEHIPIIDKHGVPIEPLAVQHARAEHLAHHASAGHHWDHHDDHHEDYHHEEHHDNYHHEEHHPIIHEGHADLHENHHGYTLHQKHAHVYGHHGHHFLPKYDYHGHPLDTEEVEHLKAAHFAAHAKLGNYL